MNQTYQNKRFIDDKILTKEFDTLQLGSKQDYCGQGNYQYTEGGFTVTVEWVVAFDGHGGSGAIQAIRGIKEEEMNEIMSEEFPHVQLQEIVLEKTAKFGRSAFETGSTMVLIKTFFFEDRNEIEYTNIGDSSGMLYINKELVFITKPHDFENGEEIIRLMTERRIDLANPLIKASSAIDVFSRKNLYSKNGWYINFLMPDGKTISFSPSQSLGHNGICGFKPTFTRFILKKTDEFKAIAMSDGVVDVMPISGVGCPVWQKYIETSSARNIVLMAERQWKQEWTVVQKNSFTTLPKMKFPVNGYDDCCCAIIEFKTPPPPPQMTTASVVSLMNDWRVVDEFKCNVFEKSTTDDDDDLYK
jgi:serine/threonine protein phosphatase PrpC